MDVLLGIVAMVVPASAIAAVLLPLAEATCSVVASLRRSPVAPAA